MRSRGMNQRTVAIVGAQGFARTLLAHLNRTPQAGFKPVCLLDTSGNEALHASGLGNARLEPPAGAERSSNEFAAKVRAEGI